MIYQCDTHVAHRLAQNQRQMWKKKTPCFFSPPLVQLPVANWIYFSLLCNTLASTGGSIFRAGLRMKRLVVKQTARAARDHCQWRADAALQLSISSFLSPHHPLKRTPRHRRSVLLQTPRIQTPDCDQPKKLLLSSSGKEGDTSAPCLFTFPTCQKRSECEDYSALPEWNSMKAQR